MRTRSLPVLFAVTLALALTGCLVESTLDAKGGGTLKMQVRGGPQETIEEVRSRFQGSGVELTKATMDDKKNISVALTYTDFRKLGGLRQFENTTFTLTDDAKAKTRTASAVTKFARPVKLPEDQLKYFGNEVTVSLTVPGEVVKTDGKAKGKTVTWKMALDKLFSAPETTFSVTYKHDGPPLAAEATPAATKAAGAAPAATPAAKK